MDQYVITKSPYTGAPAMQTNQAALAILHANILAAKSAVAPLSQCNDEYKERREAAMQGCLGEALDIVTRMMRDAA